MVNYTRFHKSLATISSEIGISRNTLKGKLKKNPALTYEELIKCSVRKRDNTPEAKKYREQYPHVYSVWRGMKNRCRRDKNYEHVSVCNEWAESFIVFAKWSVEHGYMPGLQIDRIDNDGNYCPENCRWATRKENSRNKRTCRYLTYKGETKIAADWIKIIGNTSVYDWINTHGISYAEQKLADILDNT